MQKTKSRPITRLLAQTLPLVFATATAQAQALSAAPATHAAPTTALSAPASPAERSHSDVELAAVRLHHAKIATLLTAYAPTALRDTVVGRELKRAELRLERAQTNPPPAPLPGLSEEAYISPIDGSAQPYFRYLPTAWKPPEPNEQGSQALLVFLHGYWPDLNMINWASFYPGLTNTAERMNFCVAMPFGRSNTDFQGIGEQDVVQVIDLMVSEYGVDPQRVVLAGHSMGAMGVWTIGARHAERFRGLMPIAGRGDYYAWQSLDPATIPPWERALIDSYFLPAQARRLYDMPILGFHGDADFVVPSRESEEAFRHVLSRNPRAKLILLPERDHWIIDEIMAREDTATWLAERFASPSETPSQPKKQGAELAASLPAQPNASHPSLAPNRPGATVSRIQNAMLDPFVFVQANTRSATNDLVFAQRCGEWKAFAKAVPRQRHESLLTEADFNTYNLFLFGTPEESPLIRSILTRYKIKFTAETLSFAGQKVTRADCGFWLAVPSPVNPQRTIVVNCGLPWGAALPPNHKYDMLAPDLLVYSPDAGRIGINKPIKAAELNATGKFIWQLK